MLHTTENKSQKTSEFAFNNVDPSWLPYIKAGLQKMDANYLTELLAHPNWLPGPQKIFNAFSLPLEKVNYVLLGESPYPREQSANGFAFWDANVKNLWCDTGLSREVNRATSLRNFIKMLLVADHKLLPTETGQHHIANIDKTNYITTNNDLFQNLLDKGFLLINATPVLRPAQVRIDAKLWRPFLAHILHYLLEKKPSTEFILLGKIATDVAPLLTQFAPKTLCAEHPYNISFINNPTVLDFFRPMHLLSTPNKHCDK